MLATGPFGFGPVELTLVLVIALTLFGAERLSDIGGAMVRGIRDFRREVREPKKLTTRADDHR